MDNSKGKSNLYGLLFLLSLLISAYIAVTFVPVREILETVPGVNRFFPKTEINPEKLKRKHVELRDLRALEDGLKEKEMSIAEREKALETSEATVRRLQSELTQTRDQISKMETKIAKLITEINEAEAKNLKKLAKVYNTMDAEEAATLVKNMNDDEVINIFSLMSERQVAKILGAYAVMSDENGARAAILVEKIRLLTIKRKEDAKKPAPKK